MATQSKKYENNPFFIAINGITMLFDLARGVAILLVILSVISLAGNSIPNDKASAPDPSQPVTSEIAKAFSGVSANEWIIIIAAFSIIGLAIILISTLLTGVASYTSAHTARGKRVSLGEAFRESFDKLWSFLWLQIIMTVKILLWSLLFIVPGIIMWVRYSLANVAFFDKNLRGNSAIKESMRLTQGAWITTYAANMLVNCITLGVISSLVTTAVNTVLYRQYTETGAKKPEAHWLSWLTLAITGAFIGLIVLGVILVIGALVATGGKFSE